MTENKSGIDCPIGGDQVFDPDDFTTGDWGVIAIALRRNGSYLERKAERSPEHKKAELLEAARRRHRLALRCVQARRFRKQMDEIDDPEADQAGAQPGPAPAPGAVRAGADRA